MKLLALLTFAVGVFAQQSGAPVTVTEYPHDVPTEAFFYDGSSNLIYLCQTKPKGPWSYQGQQLAAASFTFTKAATTLTNVVVSSNVGTVTTSSAHGLQAGQLVTISGATVDTDLNGTYIIQSSAATTTFTITTVAVADATYTDATLVLTTTAPRLTAAIWSITRFNYTSTNMTSKQYSNGLPAVMNQICANRATITFY